MVAAAGQLGVFAACVVLFVPMGMAGWHLSRNKVLFFSAVLFISLAVGVHFAPHILSLSHFIISSASASSLPIPRPSSCLPFLHRLSWIRSSPSPSWAWAPSAPALSCGFQRLSCGDASLLLNGSWILVAGDSQARLFVLALLRLILEPAAVASVESDLFRRHSDYHIAIAEHSIKIDFIWAPYEPNITHLLFREIRPALQYPDVLILGSGLWHMLHFANSSQYGESLVAIRRVVGLLRSRGLHHMFWLGLPMLVNPMLNTQEKRERMNNTVLSAYSLEVKERKILRCFGGPFLLLDIGSLSQGCGHRCTTDGMHYDGIVYEAALQIMLNALLIESHQRL